MDVFNSSREKLALYASELSEAKLSLFLSEACLCLMKASEWDEGLEFFEKEAAMEFATSFSVSAIFPSAPTMCWMVSTWVPLSFLTMLKTFLSGVLWLTLLTSLRKEFLFASLITLRQSARAILKSAMSVLFLVSIHFLRASFFLQDSPSAILIEPYLVFPRPAGQKRDIFLGYVQHSFGKTSHVSYCVLTKLAAFSFEGWPVGFQKLKTWD